jgi:hypothetical protein
MSRVALALSLAVSAVACGGEPSPAPVTPVEPPPPSLAPEGEPAVPPSHPAGKRPPCRGDQSCNEDRSVSALWGKCTEYGVCECHEGFELNPKGRCEPE